MVSFLQSFPDLPLNSGFLNAQLDLGARGDGTSDDTDVLNAALAAAASRSVGLYIPCGHYKVSRTLNFGSGGAGGQIRIAGVPGRTFINSTVGTAATFTGSVSGQVLTVTAMSSGKLGIGHNVTTAGGRSTIVSSGTGTGGTGSYNLISSMTAPSQAMTSGAPIILLGSNTGIPGFICGELSGLVLTGPTAAPTNGSTGLMISAMTDVEVRKVEVANTDIGFDMINNCFGCTFDNSIAGSGGTCNVGTNVRAEAGNQISMRNLWSSGLIAGVCISPEADGIAVRDGQLGVPGAGGDASGCVMFGKDYVTGNTGGVGTVTIDSVDMEGFTGWGFRGYGQISLAVYACPVISYGGNSKAMGIMKVENAMNSRVSLQSLTVRGDFVSPRAVIMNGYGGGTYLEQVTFTDSTTFAGVACAEQSLFAQSGLQPGIAIYHDYNYGDMILMGGVRLRAVGGSLQASSDRTNWSPIYTGAIARAALGASYTVPANTGVMRFVQTAAIAAATVTLRNPIGDGDTIQFANYAGPVSALTFSPAVGGWSNGSALAANTGLRIRWDAVLSAWQRE